jgi:Flp pilus assembly protein TadG
MAEDRRACSGLAAVELAVCLPLLVMIVLGSIEATNAIFFKERLTSAAYEGARSATTPGVTYATAVAAANAVLTQYKIVGGTVTITPVVTASTPTGTAVAARAVAPFSSNAILPPFIVGKVFTVGSATVVMEHQ